jgi:hypothetical protein
MRITPPHSRVGGFLRENMIFGLFVILAKLILYYIERYYHYFIKKNYRNHGLEF